MDKVKRDTVLGLVFFIGLALLILATITLSDLSLKPGKELVVYFDNARGLAVGDPVQLLGIKSGQVTAVGTEPNRRERRVRVTLRLEGEPNLRGDATIAIQDANFLGGKVVEIDPGSATELPPKDAFLTGSSTGNAFDRIADMVGGGDNANQLAGAIAGINKFFDTLNNADGSVQKLLKSSELYDQVSKFLASLQKSAESLEQGKGLAGRLLHDDKLADRADSIIKNLEKTMDKVASGEGPLGRIIYDDKLAANIDKVVDDVAKIAADVRAGKGALGMLISDEDFKNRLSKIGDNVDQIMAKLNDPNAGLLGALAGDTKLLADGRELVADLSAVARDLRHGDGALPRLIREKELGRQIERTLNQITRAVEDAREAAPIGTIFQVFAGAF